MMRPLVPLRPLAGDATAGGYITDLILGGHGMPALPPYQEAMPSTLEPLHDPEPEPDDGCHTPNTRVNPAGYPGAGCHTLESKCDEWHGMVNGGAPAPDEM